jgi:hypothetical protein
MTSSSDASKHAAPGLLELPESCDLETEGQKLAVPRGIPISQSPMTILIGHAETDDRLGEDTDTCDDADEDGEKRSSPIPGFGSL